MCHRKLFLGTRVLIRPTYWNGIPGRKPRFYEGYVNNNKSKELEDGRRMYEIWIEKDKRSWWIVENELALNEEELGRILEGNEPWKDEEDNVMLRTQKRIGHILCDIGDKLGLKDKPAFVLDDVVDGVLQLRGYKDVVTSRDQIDVTEYRMIFVNMALMNRKSRFPLCFVLSTGSNNEGSVIGMTIRHDEYDSNVLVRFERMIGVKKTYDKILELKHGEKYTIICVVKNKI